MQYSKNATTFPCEHEYIHESNSVKRCATCRMPIVDEAIYHDAFNSEALFCCFECKKYYIEAVDEMGVL